MKIKNTFIRQVYSFLFAGLALVLAAESLAKTYKVASPDKRVQLRVSVDNHIQWSASFNNKKLLLPSTIDLKLYEGERVLQGVQVVSNATTSVDQTLSPPVKQKSATIRDHYNLLTLAFDNQWQLEFRAYDKGAAYRLIYNGKQPLTIDKEIAEFIFPAGTSSLFPEEESFSSHFERLYRKLTVADIETRQFASLPAYVETAKGVKTVITEADLFDYPGMFLFGTGGDGLQAGFPGKVEKATPTPGSEDRNEQLDYFPYMAQVAGPRSFPWRVMVMSDQASDLVESQLVYQLSRENQLADSSWIKPGRVAWDWYNANNIYGVDFVAGLNTETYKYYIDFAARYGIEYVILDEGWSKSSTNIVESNPDLDVHELIRYGKTKSVGIILWNLWKPLDNDYTNILKTYGEWGVAGIKVDFMQRADQDMVAYYEKIAREAARHHLLVDYHGGFKPSGLRRAYPNVITYEGVKGNENNKWSQDITPEHNVTLPFIRMVAGPMDYTPGAMRNTTPGNHRISHFRPMSMGTRAHQVAMYAVYESPLQMLCDAPSAYLRESEVTAFITRFPSVWDETRVLAGEVGQYIVVARRSGERWYLGAMTNGDARTLEIDLSFVEAGSWMLTELADGVNADKFAEDYRIETGEYKPSKKFTIKMAPGGGWSAIIERR